VHADWFGFCRTNRRQNVEVKSSIGTLICVCVCVCGALKHGVPEGLIPRPLLFMINIKYLLVRISSLSEPIIFADDTSVTISSKK